MAETELQAGLTSGATASQPVASERGGRALVVSLLLDLALVAILGLGAYLRFVGLAWDADQHLHPDERFLTMVETGIQPVASLGEYFDTSASPLNPHNRGYSFFVYGTLPIFLTRYLAETLQQTGYDQVHLVGRFLSALFDLASVFGIYLVARGLFDRRVALLSAAFSAFSVMLIQQAHFFTVDSFANTFVVYAFYFAVRVARSPASRAGRVEGLWNFALFGVVFGMAVASKINTFPEAGVLVMAGLLVVNDAYRDRLSPELGRKVLNHVMAGLALAGAASLVTFRICQPYAFAGPSLFGLSLSEQWKQNMSEVSGLVAGRVDFPPALQWTGRPKLLFPWLNMVLWGMGLPLGLAAWAGWAWAAWRMSRGQWEKFLLPVAWVGAYFAWQGSQWAMTMRYQLPIYPFVEMLGAWAIVELWEVGRGRNDERRAMNPSLILQRSSFIVGAVVLTGSFGWAFAFTRIYTRPVTRVQASRWIYQNVPGPVNVHIRQPDGSMYNQPLPLPANVLDVDGQTVLGVFKARVSGDVESITLGHLGDPLRDGELELLRLRLMRGGGGQTLAEAAAYGDFAAPPDPRGDPYTFNFDPVPVQPGLTYEISLTAETGAPVSITGSAIANESSWDDGLPLRIDGYDGFGGIYTGVNLELYWDDTAEKRDMLVNLLSQADYVMISSNRQYGSIPRLPLRYPLTIEYYRQLFAGNLGFDLVADFESKPTFGPWSISDQAAEESFTVYDHPRVLIYEKSADFSAEKVRRLLESIDLAQVIRQSPLQATAAPTGLMLPENRLAVQRQGGTWAAMFDPNALLNSNHIAGAAAWYLALVLLGWLAFPLAFAAFHGLPDRGYAVAKTLALLVIAWLAWLGASLVLPTGRPLLPFTRGSLALMVLLLGMLSAILAWRRKQEMLDFLRRRRRYLLAVESITLAFFFDLAIRWGNGDLWHPNFGGEKPMDFSYLNAVLKSTSFPPYDPWFAGGYINYYYFGFVLAAAPIKLLGMAPSLAYNLLLPTLFALTAMGAWCAAYNLAAGRQSSAVSRQSSVVSRQSSVVSRQSSVVSRQSSADSRWASDSENRLPSRNQPQLNRINQRTQASDSENRLPSYNPSPYVAGVAAALLVVVLGNLGQVQVLADAFGRLAPEAGAASSLPGVPTLTRAAVGVWRVLVEGQPIPLGTGSWYWDATRIIPPGEGEAGPITEFPFFTFLYADLHAHLINLPLTLLALAWSLGFLLAGGERRQSVWRVETFALWGVGGLALGVLNPTNTWDYPLYWMLGVIAVAYGTWRANPKSEWNTLVTLGLRVVLLIALARLFFLPYTQWYGAGYNEAELWKGSRTPIGAYLYIHGLFLFILVTFCARETRRWLAETPAEALRASDAWVGPALLGLLALVGGMAGAWYLGYDAALVALPLMAWAGALMLRSRPAMSDEKRAVFALLGLGLALSLLVEVVVLKGDISRMNTVFKFYLQVWVLFSVAAGAALAWIIAELPEWAASWRTGWSAALAVLVMGAGLYTATATAAKVRDRMAPEAPRTLDGMAYMEYATYHDQGQPIPLASDYDAIRWLQMNVVGSPVIVEANVPEYRWGSRFTIYTGLPGVVGWNWHQRQQRAVTPPELVTRRVQAIQDFYSTTDAAAALSFLRSYDVAYVVVGRYEQAYYPAAGLAKFDEMAAEGRLSVVYRNGGVTIYGTEER